MASDVASVLEQLNVDDGNKDLLEYGFILVGHSMGAKVALATLSALPTHQLKELKGLVLVAPAPPTSLDLPPEMKAQQAVAYETEQSIRWTLENVLAKPENLTEQDMKLVVHDSLSGNQLAKKAWPTYGMQEDISHGLRRALASIGSMKIRACIIVGEFDVVEPKERVDTEVRRFLEENGLQVSLKIANDVKHLILLEAPKVVHKEISLF